VGVANLLGKGEETQRRGKTNTFFNERRGWVNRGKANNNKGGGEEIYIQRKKNLKRKEF